MAKWTHVAAIVRIDSFRLGKSEPDWRDYFGGEASFNEMNVLWSQLQEHPEEYLPYGTEGTLKSSLWINPDTTHVAAYTLSIFGDLRYAKMSPEQIIEWFKMKVTRISEQHIGMVRQAMISVDFEEDSPLFWQYKDY